MTTRKRQTTTSSDALKPDDVLRRMLNTPPTPKVKPPKPAPAAPKKAGGRVQPLLNQKVRDDVGGPNGWD
ncbi:hypothetical protein [Caenimonas aquaedulcis]|uniref:Uncharacterized protein n=1 Tax=Caenimonas aquaedulcis TaxID=2793270 RepID=A0A931H4A4_9BURK|nr:hypothetical protein [Caenimonas aquaedulcis]MBG9388356.1 hypothetical protein [Caenimonas aquaedulcis]